ncbi:MAG: hypothetical protein J6M08_02840 [Methanobrevibacter sp.]|nr:hypothetical protein [Methanobrevibacter sp.]
MLVVRGHPPKRIESSQPSINNTKAHPPASRTYLPFSYFIVAAPSV